MKFHKATSTLGAAECEINMTPTLDVIFQLLTFFVMTFKPVIDEGQFAVNMSAMSGGAAALPTVVPGMPDETESPPDAKFNPPFRILLLATPDGRLASGGIVLGAGRVMPHMRQLEFEIRNVVGDYPEDFEAIIEADPRLKYEYLLQAVNAVSHTGIRQINFGPPPATPGATQ